MKILYLLLAVIVALSIIQGATSSCRSDKRACRRSCRKCRRICKIMFLICVHNSQKSAKVTRLSVSAGEENPHTGPVVG